jgi:hypothetical protein
MFCTYAHYTPQGRLFYIGKGSSELRAYRMTDRNNYWHKIVNKYGKPEVQILAHWSNEEEAFSHEKLLISCFRDLGHKLANFTDGGDGVSGYKHTLETREKNRLASLGNKYALGHKVSEESRKLMGADKIGKPTSARQKAVASQVHKGTAHATGNTNRRKWIWVGTNIVTGETSKFIGMLELNKAGFQHSNIIKCINGNRKSHKGYTWSKELWEKTKCQ